MCDAHASNFCIPHSPTRQRVGRRSRSNDHLVFFAVRRTAAIPFPVVGIGNLIPVLSNTIRVYPSSLYKDGHSTQDPPSNDTKQAWLRDNLTMQSYFYKFRALLVVKLLGLLIIVSL